MNNEKLNKLVQDFQNDRSDETFNEIYAIVSANWRSLDTVGKSIRASKEEVIAAYQDTLLNCIESYDGRTDFIHLLNRSIRYKRRDIYRRKKRLSEFEVNIAPSENEDGSESPTLEFRDDFDLEEEIITKKKADQLALIDFLLSDADAKTIGVVNAFLQHPKPTPTAIGKVLGLHHSTVIRTLERLAGKFDSRQYGEYSDYLTAL